MAGRSEVFVVEQERSVTVIAVMMIVVQVLVVMVVGKPVQVRRR